MTWAAKLVSPRTLVYGTTEYLVVEVTAEETLTAQPVAISVDRGLTWHTAAWKGDEGTTRAAQVLATPGVLGGGFVNRPVLVRITHDPELPWLHAGTLTVIGPAAASAEAEAIGVAAHEAAPDPHPQYATADDIAAAVAAHAADEDPHAAYATGEEVTTIAAAEVAAHEGEANPHPVYVLDTAATTTYARRAANLASMRKPGALVGTAHAETVTVAAVGSAATLAQVVTAGPRAGGGGGAAGGPFAYRAGGVVIHGASFPDTYVVRATYVTDASITNGANPLNVDFWVDDTDFELIYKGTTGYYRVYCDGQLITGADTTVAQDGAIKYRKFTFPTRRPRLISVESSNLLFGGVALNATGSVWPAHAPGPRCIVLGDSFTGGTGATYGGASSWVRRFAEVMRWPDTWASALGGTGYLNPSTGGKVKFRDRLQDVTSYAPDVVVVAGGLNDLSGYTAAQVGTEAAALFEAIQDALPNALLVVTSPFFYAGPRSYGTGTLDIKDAIEAAAVAAGAVWLDVLEMPLTKPAVTTTIGTATAAGVTTVRPNVVFSPGTVIELGTGAVRERRTVVSGSGGSAPYSVVVDAATSYAHAVGEPVTEVGRGLWTGTGRVGATAGNGNADVYVSSDGVHPSQAGHDALGHAVASLLLDALGT